DIAADATRAVEVIQNVRSLVHKGEGIRMPLNLNSVIIDSVRITKQDVISHASILTTELDPELPEVDGDAVQIQQVLLNLIANALEAMGGIAPSERRIVIRTRLGNEHMVELIVRDHGSGLPKDNPGKIFDHFYSTKQRGMGMGLSIVQSIVEAHAGTIKAENAPDHGARIVIRLPAVKAGVVEKSGQLIEDNAFHLRSPKDFP
ncbi:MAG: GHKL domain-containing protein, partial [Verrucomicrobia bacterium]|nr:GHKL domain-containing protein [Verrucomicrobiota bacterium]